MGRSKLTPEEREARRLRDRSRPERWQDACNSMRNVLEDAKTKAEELVELLESDSRTGDEDASAAAEVEQLREEAKELISAINSSLGEFSNGDIEDVKSEYESWRDGMSGTGLENTSTYEKLDEVCNADTDIEIPSELSDDADIDDVKSFIDELDNAISAVDDLEQIDLPRGFGRD